MKEREGKGRKEKRKKERQRQRQRDTEREGDRLGLELDSPCESHSSYPRVDSRAFLL